MSVQCLLVQHFWTLATVTRKPRCL